MDYWLIVLVVGAVFLAIGAGVVLLAKRATRGTDAPDPQVSPFVFGVLAAGHVFLAIVQTLDGDFVWQGALHLSLAFAWMLLWRLNVREARKSRRKRGY